MWITELELSPPEALIVLKWGRGVRTAKFSHGRFVDECSDLCLPLQVGGDLVALAWTGFDRATGNVGFKSAAWRMDCGLALQKRGGVVLDGRKEGGGDTRDNKCGQGSEDDRVQLGVRFSAIHPDYMPQNTAKGVGAPFLFVGDGGSSPRGTAGGSPRGTPRGSRVGGSISAASSPRRPSSAKDGQTRRPSSAKASGSHGTTGAHHAQHGVHHPRPKKKASGESGGGEDLTMGDLFAFREEEEDGKEGVVLGTVGGPKEAASAPAAGATETSASSSGTLDHAASGSGTAAPGTTPGLPAKKSGPPHVTSGPNKRSSIATGSPLRKKSAGSLARTGSSSSVGRDHGGKVHHVPPKSKGGDQRFASRSPPTRTKSALEGKSPHGSFHGTEAKAVSPSASVMSPPSHTPVGPSTKKAHKSPVQHLSSKTGWGAILGSITKKKGESKFICEVGDDVSGDVHEGGAHAAPGTHHTAGANGKHKKHVPKKIVSSAYFGGQQPIRADGQRPSARRGSDPGGVEAAEFSPDGTPATTKTMLWYVLKEPTWERRELVEDIVYAFREGGSISTYFATPQSLSRSCDV